MFADYVLPMGHGPERHDTQSYEQYGGKWLGLPAAGASGRDGASRRARRRHQGGQSR